MPQLFSIPTPYRCLITIAFVVVIVLLSVTPGREQAGDTVFGWLVANTATPVQKTLHVVVYATLAALWMWTLADLESKLLRIALALLLSIGLGAALEWYQTQVPGRFGTLADVLLNAVGAIAGVVLAAALL